MNKTQNSVLLRSKFFKIGHSCMDWIVNSQPQLLRILLFCRNFFKLEIVDFELSSNWRVSLLLSLDAWAQAWRRWWFLISWFQKLKFALLLLGFEKLGLELDSNGWTTGNAHRHIFSLWSFLGPQAGKRRGSCARSSKKKWERTSRARRRRRTRSTCRTCGCCAARTRCRTATRGRPFSPSTTGTAAPRSPSTAPTFSPTFSAPTRSFFRGSLKSVWRLLSWRLTGLSLNLRWVWNPNNQPIDAVIIPWSYEFSGTKWWLKSWFSNQIYYWRLRRLQIDVGLHQELNFEISHNIYLK